jgi:hypothetical protein
VWTVTILYKQWKIQKYALHGRSLELSLPFRIIAFGFYIIIALRCVAHFVPVLFIPNRISTSLSLLSIKSPQSPAPDLMIATGVIGVTPSLRLLYLARFYSRFRGYGHFWNTKGYSSCRALLELAQS